ncbi:hypothetical protein EYC80_005292 [Monilinia laxa]|uniref:Uncharacterized protein n=1 Tax=Monilinia laxa TaxID=61186 RepID=A0A5N6KJF4_MONLA|nr:hypothetical protein EYC80_005292 [Monilinia laxa]
MAMAMDIGNGGFREGLGFLHVVFKFRSSPALSCIFLSVCVCLRLSCSYLVLLLQQLCVEYFDSLLLISFSFITFLGEGKNTY